MRGAPLSASEFTSVAVVVAYHNSSEPTEPNKLRLLSRSLCLFLSFSSGMCVMARKRAAEATLAAAAALGAGVKQFRFSTGHTSLSSSLREQLCGAGFSQSGLLAQLLGPNVYTKMATAARTNRPPREPWIPAGAPPL